MPDLNANQWMRFNQEPAPLMNFTAITSSPTKQEAALVTYFYELGDTVVDSDDTHIKLTGFIVRAVIDTMRYQRTLQIDTVAKDPNEVQRYDHLIQANHTAAGIRIKHHSEKVPAKTVLSDIETQLDKAQAEDEGREQLINNVRDYIASLGKVVDEIPYGGTEAQAFVAATHTTDPLSQGV